MVKKDTNDEIYHKLERIAELQVRHDERLRQLAEELQIIEKLDSRVRALEQARIQIYAWAVAAGFFVSAVYNFVKDFIK